MARPTTVKIGKFSNCPQKRDPKKALISEAEALSLEGVFKTFANATRLKMLYALLMRPNLCVTEISEGVKMTPQAVSNQLQKLVYRGVLVCKKNGKLRQYQIVDPCVEGLFDHALCFIKDSLPDRNSKK